MRKEMQDAYRAARFYTLQALEAALEELEASATKAAVHEKLELEALLNLRRDELMRVKELIAKDSG